MVAATAAPMVSGGSDDLPDAPGQCRQAQDGEFQRPIRGFRLAQHVDEGAKFAANALLIESAVATPTAKRVNAKSAAGNGFRPRASDGVVQVPNSAGR